MRRLSFLPILLMLFMVTLAEAQMLKFGHVYTTDRRDHLCATAVADEIGKRTNGRYNIQVFPGGTLGSEDAQHSGLALGTVDLLIAGSAFLASSYAPFGIDMAPFAFRDFNHFIAYTKSDLFRQMKEGYSAKTGHQILGTHYQGVWHVLANKVINTPADMKGLKMRVPNAPMYLIFPRAVGANPAPIAYSEAYLALQQGVVDVMDQGLAGIKTMKFYEVRKVINLTGHIVSAVQTIVAGPVWKRLPDADKKVFAEVIAAESEKCSRAVRQDENDLLAEFSKTLTINDVRDRPAFVEAVRPFVTAPNMGWTKAQYEQLLAIK